MELDSGKLGSNGKTRVTADFNHLTSDGFQTFNAQQRSSGGIKVQYKFSDEKVLTGFSGVVLLDTNTPNTKGPTRAQYQAQYNYLLQNTDPTRSDYVNYNFYHIPPTSSMSATALRSARPGTSTPNNTPTATTTSRTTP